MIYRRVDHIIAISTVIARNVLETHPVRSQRVSVVHHGVAVDRFHRDEQVRYRVRAEFGIDEQNLLIGIIGRLQDGKGHLEFLHMAERISAEWPAVRFLVVGAPTHGEEERAEPIFRCAAELGLEKRVIFTGYRRDVPDILSALDLFVFPSHAESFGLVIIEAMAAGLPVISSRNDGVLDIVCHEETGLLVDPKDIAELTGAVDRLLRDADLRQRLGRDGRTWVERNFNQDNMIDRLLELYTASQAARDPDAKRSASVINREWP
jgi:glycosyltransferase involved in cell wall biosynthesis